MYVLIKRSGACHRQNPVAGHRVFALTPRRARPPKVGHKLCYHHTHKREKRKGGGSSAHFYLFKSGIKFMRYIFEKVHFYSIDVF